MVKSDTQSDSSAFAVGDAPSGYVVRFVDLVARTRSIQADAEAAIRAVASRSDFILGQDTRLFEEEFAQYVGTKHAVGVGSGLDALRLSLEALGIGPGDDVLVPVNTFVATALAIHAVGGRPVLIDCDPQTYNMAADCADAAVTKATRAIIPVHLTGQAADMAPLLDIAKRHGLKVVEDVAQAPGATYRIDSDEPRRCGTFGDAGCFSFYAGKNFGCWGDGGMVTTNDDRLAERIRHLRHYGQRVRYEHTVKGGNSRLDTLQAAILRSMLPRLHTWNERRRDLANRYRECLTGVGDLRFQQTTASATHVYHLFVIETLQRDALQTHLTRTGIETLIHYPRPIHLQPAFSDLGYAEGDFPQAERLSQRILSLPLYPELTEEQQDFVIHSVRAFFS